MDGSNSEFAFYENSGSVLGMPRALRQRFNIKSCFSSFSKDDLVLGSAFEESILISGEVYMERLVLTVRTIENERLMGAAIDCFRDFTLKHAITICPEHKVNV